MTQGPSRSRVLSESGGSRAPGRQRVRIWRRVGTGLWRGRERGVRVAHRAWIRTEAARSSRLRAGVTDSGSDDDGARPVLFVGVGDDAAAVGRGVVGWVMGRVNL